VIYVTLGTHEQPFTRALDVIAEAAALDDLVVQHGHTKPIDLGGGVEWRAFVRYGEATKFMEDSSAVVSHAGVGCLMSAIAAGHVPVALPRLRRYGEHVDDHQMQIAERLSTDGLAIICHSSEEFPSALQIARSSRQPNVRRATLVNEIARVVREFAA
jgi:UDP-N-acetylglucosamine transferase subunit ALG13